VAVVTVSVVDSRGRHVPVAGNEIQFALAGNGAIIGVGNGDPSCHEPDKYLAAAGEHPWKRSLFNGLAQIIVQAGKKPGVLKLKATGEGLRACAITITSAS
jgi:beta-galactosidase